MKHCNTKEHTTRGILLTACVTALAMALTVARPHASDDDRVRPPRVPALIEVPAGNEAVLVGHAEQGTQNYICLPTGSGVAWILFTPQATLFSDRGRQLQTHFFSLNPEEPGVVRATWQDSRDTSRVWGRVSQPSSDPNFVRPGAIPWLLVEKVGVQEGPTGGDNLTETTYIQRVNTVGGVAPSTGCALSTDIGRQAFVPYTADYFFFEKAGRHGRDDH